MNLLANTTTKKITFVVVCCNNLLLSSPAVLSERLSTQNTSPCEAGDMLLEIASVIDAQSIPDSGMDTIVEFGTDTRYYLLIRGWLKEKLLITKHQLDVTSVLKQRQKLLEKKQFLEKAIRRIDLE